MLADSVLGRMYVYWLYSGIFAFLRRVYRSFLLAWPHSRAAALVHRRPRADGYYEASLIGRCLNGVCGLLLRLVGYVGRVSAPAWRGSRIAGLCGGSVFLRFEFMLGAFVCLMFIAPHDYWSNGLALAGAGGLFALYLTLCGLGRRRLLYPCELGLPFLLLAIACGASLIFTTAPGDSLRVLMFYVTAFLLCWVVASDMDSRDRLMGLMGFIYAAVVLTGLYAVAQRIMGVEVSSSFTDLSLNKGVPGRVFSTLDNPNNFAEFLVLFLPLSAAWALNVGARRLRLPLLLALCAPALGLLMTYSRSGWLSIFLALFVFVYYSDKKLVPLLLVLCVMAIPFLPDSVVTRLGTIFNTRDSSASHRLVTWGCILNMLGDDGNWLTGIGLGPLTFSDRFPAYAQGLAKKGVYHSQMLYMELVLEMGILGLVSFLWLMCRSVKNGALALYRSREPEIRSILAACCASFIGIAVCCVFEYIWFYPRVLFAFFILLGVLMAATRTAQNEKEGLQ